MLDGKVKILVVDDEEINLRILADILGRQGYAISTASDGDEALEYVDDTVDLVLLDIEMPRVDGIEVLKKIREKHSRTDMPVVMVTQRTTSEDMVRALDLGANDYITKPIDLPVLLARIRSQLDIKEGEQGENEGSTV